MKYFFKAQYRQEWGDPYQETEIVVKAKNKDEARKKALKVYEDITGGEWEGSAELDLQKVEG